jgi:uncharacterized protein (TIGR01777 family)
MAASVAITGSTGFVGAALAVALARAGGRVVRLLRTDTATLAPGERAVRWDPAAGTIDAGGLEGVDAVVHLSGERISGRWTAARRARIRESRVGSTQMLARTLATLERPPRTLVAASAVGYYGDRGDEILREESAPGRGFLAEVCREWEAATEPAARAGVRVVHLRIGMVLSVKGGGLPALLRPFRLGLGGPIGPGTQWVSWITLDDLVGAVRHALATEGLAGPVNAVAPGAATNRVFARTLGRVLGRPALLPLPAPLARLLLGRMADELLLASARVVPARLEATGFAFADPALEGALRRLLGR